MRKINIVGGIAAVSLITLAGVAVAQQGPGRARIDADGDGRISQAEFVERRVTRLTAVDTNRDGNLAAPEATAAMQARRAERMAARFDRLDADRNGSLTRAEFEAGHAGRAERSGRRAERMERRLERRGPVSIEQAQSRASETFSRLDADRDGYLTAEERRAGREGMREARQARRADRTSQAAPAAE